MSSKFFATLNWFQEQTKNEHEPVVVYKGNQMQTRTKGTVFPWNHVDAIYK